MADQDTVQAVKKTKSFAATLILMVFLMIAFTALCVGGLGVYYLNRSMNTSTTEYNEAMMQGYRTEIKSEVQSAIAFLQYYYDLSQSGALSEEEAKALAAEGVRAMRYRDDGSGYMWIDDTDYTLVMHPILPEQEGDNRYDLTDQNGVKIIQNIMKSAEAGGGYNEFYFTKADGTTVAPKLAYSEKFAPWNWVVTTGNYIDDMQAQAQDAEDAIRGQASRMIVIFIVVSVIVLAVSLTVAALFGRHTVRDIGSVEKALEKLAGGNLAFHTDEKLLRRKDEIGEMARYLGRVKSSLTSMIGNVVNIEGELNSSSENFNQKFEDITDRIQSANRAIEELAQGATNQAGETETVSSKIVELGDVIETEKSDVNRLRESVSSMTEYSAGASSSIDKLNKITQATIDAIGVVSEQTNKNNESAADINKAVEIIKGLAAQTNLLSLNASIEAARAGEAGRGFAVVAEEIRNLSEESSSSAQEIESIVRELTGNVASSVDKMQEVTRNVQEQQKCLEETRQAFGHLYEEIHSVEDAAQEIGEQTNALDALKRIVTDSVNNLSSVVQENAASTQETSATMAILSQTIHECTEDTQALVDLSQRQSQETNKFKL